MIKLHSSTHKIDTVFVAALFTVFAATSFLVVLIGAKQYQKTADTMNYNYEVRTATSYITEKIRQSDSSCDIQIAQLSDVTVLALSTIENGKNYITYIYSYEGWLRELFISESTVFSPSAGQKIVEVSDFSVSHAGTDLLEITFTGTDGITYPVYLVIHSIRKEAS